MENELDDKQIAEIQSRKRKKTLSILLPIIGIAVILLTVKIILSKPLSLNDQMKMMVKDNVLTNLIMAVEKNDVSGYESYFNQPISDKVVKMISEFKKGNGDTVKFMLYSPKLTLYPSGITEIEAETSAIFVINKVAKTNGFHYFFQRRDTSRIWKISDQQYNERYIGHEPAPRGI